MENQEFDFLAENFDQMLEHTLQMMAQENVIVGAPVTSYADILARCSVTDLRRIAKTLAEKGYSKLPKAQLIDLILASNNLPLTLEAGLMAEDLDGWELFCRACQVDAMPCQHGTVVMLLGLQNCGLVQCFQSEGAYFVVVPDRVKQAFETLKDTGFLVRKNHNVRLREYLLATTHLYGVLTISDFVDIFNKMSNDTTTAEEVTAFVATYSHGDYGIHDKYVAHSDLVAGGFADIQELLKQVSDKPRYLPDAQELVRYANPDYYEKTTHTEMVVEYLKQIVSDPEMVQEIADELCYTATTECSVEDLFGILDDFEVELKNDAQVQVMGNVFIDLRNHARIWFNNGHTAKEIHDMQHPEQSEQAAAPRNPKNPQQAFSAKIGRNDPCPCGSGKKYKKCCGR